MDSLDVVNVMKIEANLLQDLHINVRVGIYIYFGKIYEQKQFQRRCTIRQFFKCGCNPKQITIMNIQM